MVGTNLAMAPPADKLDRALQARKVGRLPDAEAIYREILVEQPTDADVWCLLGAVLRDQQRYADAIATYRHAADLRPDQPHVWNGLGIAQACWRRFEDAEHSFRKALELNPEYAKGWNNLGNTLSELRKLPEAIDAYRRAQDHGYGESGLDDSLGQVLARQGDLDAAAACFRRVLTQRPDDAGILTRYAVILARQGELDLAATTMARALRRPAPDADVFFRLGDALSDKGKLDLAVKCHERSLQLRPNEFVVLNHLATVRLQQGELAEAAVQFRRAVAVRPDDQWSSSSLLFARTNDPAVDPDELFEDHVDWARRHMGGNAERGMRNAEFSSALRNPNSAIPLKVGYVSPDFRRHPVGRFMEAVLAHHDRTRVEVFCYDESSRPPDEVADRLRAAAQHWREIKEKPHAEVAAMVRADAIDILIDLAGHTGGSRLGLFALRPAPVMVTYLGYPNTTGVGAIDYVIVDPITQPPSEPARFIEEPVRLPNGFCCYTPRDDAPPPGPLPALANGHVTFGAFHNLPKLNGAVLDLWRRVLDAVPGSKLLVGRNTLSGETRELLRKRFAAHGIGDNRLELRHLVAGPAAFLEAYLPVDISLDPFPWSGHTTACDSLWMGVPVVTLRGQTHAGRMVSSVLHYAGLPDWIAETPDDYVKLAAKWAANLPKLAEVRAGLRERVRTSKLSDARGFTRQLEDAFQQMWRRWCGRGPELANLSDALTRGEQFRGAERHAAAEDAYRQATRHDPFAPEAWAGLAAACNAQGKLDEATAHYRRALELRPQDPRTHNSLGIVYAKQLRHALAEAHFRAAIDLNPDYAKAHNNLGNSLSEQGNLDAAAVAFRAAERLGFRDPTLYCNLAIVDSRLGFLDRAKEQFGQALALDPANQTAQSALLFLKNYDPDADLDALFAEHKKWGAARFSALSPPPQGGRGQNGALRIGYVSPDFRNHPVGRFIEPVLAAHDPRRVEVFCYDEAPFPPDAVTVRLRARCANWRITRGQTDEQLAQQIQTDRIDVLIDLAGHTANNRLAVFARRPAPVQVTYLGYPNTTGLPAIDYVIVDPVTLPEGDPVRFVEKPFRLPGGFSCFAPPDAPPVNDLPAGKNGFVTFLSAHGLIKLNRAVLDLWAALVKAVPNARLRIVRDMLTSDAQAYFRNEFRRRGVPDARVDLIQPPLGAAAYFEVYHHADLSLDAFPWTGHTTCCESLWMGVPTISLRGKTHAGRMVASVLTHAGLPDWIADTPEQYVQLAAKWASNPLALAAVRAGLREKVRRSALCDAVGFTRRLEDAFRKMAGG